MEMKQELLIKKASRLYKTLLIYIRTHDNFYLLKISVFISLGFPSFGYSRSYIRFTIFVHRPLPILNISYVESIQMLYLSHISVSFTYRVFNNNIEHSSFFLYWMNQENEEAEDEREEAKKDYRWINKYFRHSFGSNLAFYQYENALFTCNVFDNTSQI